MMGAASKDLAAVNAEIAMQECTLCEAGVGPAAEFLTDSKGRATAILCPKCVAIVRNLEAGTLRDSHLDHVFAWKAASNQRRKAA